MKAASDETKATLKQQAADYEQKLSVPAMANDEGWLLVVEALLQEGAKAPDPGQAEQDELPEGPAHLLPDEERTVLSGCMFHHGESL